MYIKKRLERYRAGGMVQGFKPTYLGETWIFWIQLAPVTVVFGQRFRCHRWSQSHPFECGESPECLLMKYYRVIDVQWFLPPYGIDE